MMKDKLSVLTLATMDEPNAMLGDYLKPNELYSEGHIEELAAQLLVWAETDNKALKLSQFATLKRISFSTLCNFVNRSDNFARCWEEAKRIIGDRREIFMLTGKMNLSGMSQMVKYDDSFRKVEEWRSKLRRKIEELDAAKKIIVQLQNYEVPQGFSLVRTDSIPETLQLVKAGEHISGWKLEVKPEPKETPDNTLASLTQMPTEYGEVG